MRITQTLLVLLCTVSGMAVGESTQCLDARSAAENYAHELERAAKKLKYCATDNNAIDLYSTTRKLEACAGAGYLARDCSSEFQKAKQDVTRTSLCDYEFTKATGVFNEYEAALVEVGNNCE